MELYNNARFASILAHIYFSLAIDVLMTMDYLVILYPNYSVVQTICTTTIQVSQKEHDQDKAGDAIGEPYPQLGL
jgi:hypothetical protein